MKKERRDNPRNILMKNGKLALWFGFYSFWMQSTSNFLSYTVFYASKSSRRSAENSLNQSFIQSLEYHCRHFCLQGWRSKQTFGQFYTLALDFTLELNKNVINHHGNSFLQIDFNKKHFHMLNHSWMMSSREWLVRDQSKQLDSLTSCSWPSYLQWPQHKHNFMKIIVFLLCWLGNLSCYLVSSFWNILRIACYLVSS